MSYQLLRHQIEGVDFLTKQPSGLLAFEQGLGKSLVAIDAFKRMLAEGKIEQLLIVCPNSLKRNWLAEFEKFAPEIPVAIAEGKPSERRATFANPKTAVVITSYETARSEVTGILALVQRRCTALAMDESHAAKNWKSLTSAAARTFSPFCKYRWLLSGTPVTNTASDLYTQVEILSPGEHLLGSLESFLAHIEIDPEGTFARDIFDRLVLRRTKEECLDLPDKTFSDVIVELPAWQRKLYDDMRHEMVCEIQAMTGKQYQAFASTALAQLTRLSQLASNPALLFPELEKQPAKFEVLKELLSDILSTPGRKVLIWSNYIKTIESLLVQFESVGAVAIYGKIPNKDRQEIADSFQNDCQTRVLIANPAAAGTGFTLTAATYTIYESLSWRYDHYAQSQDRNHRIGQTKAVSYMRLIAADTIEHAIVSALERKSVLARGLLGDDKTGQLVSQLSKEQICELLVANKLPE